MEGIPRSTCKCSAETGTKDPGEEKSEGEDGVVNGKERRRVYSKLKPPPLPLLFASTWDSCVKLNALPLREIRLFAE